MPKNERDGGGREEEMRPSYNKDRIAKKKGRTIIKSLHHERLLKKAEVMKSEK